MNSANLDHPKNGGGLDRENIIQKIDELKHLYQKLYDSLPNAAGERARVAKIIRERIRQRRKRDQFFPVNFFADPAWDMLLDLYAAHYENRRVSVSSLCIASAVPATTALRHIASLVEKGYFSREIDDADARRIYVTLTPLALEALDAYFGTRIMQS